LSARRRRTDAELDEATVSMVPDTADDPEVALQKKSRTEALRQSLTRLSPDHREVIDLAYYHGKSVKEIAVIVGSLKSNVIGELQVAFYSHDGVCGIAAPWDERNFRGERGSAPKGQHSSQMQNGFEFEPHVSVQPIGKLVALQPATAPERRSTACALLPLSLFPIGHPDQMERRSSARPGHGSHAQEDQPV